MNDHRQSSLSSSSAPSGGADQYSVPSMAPQWNQLHTASHYCLYSHYYTRKVHTHALLTLADMPVCTRCISLSVFVGLQCILPTRYTSEQTFALILPVLKCYWVWLTAV